MDEMDKRFLTRTLPLIFVLVVLLFVGIGAILWASDKLTLPGKIAACENACEQRNWTYWGYERQLTEGCYCLRDGNIPHFIPTGLMVVKS